MKGSLLVEESPFSTASVLLFDRIFKRHAGNFHAWPTDAFKFGYNWTTVTASPYILPSHDWYSTFRTINLPLCNLWSVYCSKENLYSSEDNGNRTNCNKDLILIDS
jgi:hypothetical protein